MGSTSNTSSPEWKNPGPPAQGDPVMCARSKVVSHELAEVEAATIGLFCGELVAGRNLLAVRPDGAGQTPRALGRGVYVNVTVVRIAAPSCPAKAPALELE